LPPSANNDLRFYVLLIGTKTKRANVANCVGETPLGVILSHVKVFAG
jgi:hypothetical protein